MTSEPYENTQPRAVAGRRPAWSGTAGSRELLHRILLATDGTVTLILEAFANERIEAVRLAQSLQPAGVEPAELLAVEPGSSVLDRHVLLRGADSGATFLYGESLIVASRLDRNLLDDLDCTHKPIGHLLRASRLETFREVLAVGEQAAGPYGTYFDCGGEAVLLFRTYRIILRGQPIALITERVLP